MDWLSKIRLAAPKFWELPAAKKALVIETVFESTLVMIVLRSPWWRRLIRRAPLEKQRPMIDDPAIPAVAALVNGTMSYQIRPTTCLERALTLQRVLFRRGVYAPLVFGVRHEGHEQIAAHAWLEHPALPEDLLSDEYYRLYGSLN